MTDDRPKPEYGEYATPEQQATAMGRVYVPPEQVAAEQAIGDRTMSQVTLAPGSGYANRFFTLFLLAVGALNLIEMTPAYFNYAALFKTPIAVGIGTVTVPSSVGGAGIPTLIANVVIYGAAVALSALALRRGKLSFYIPIAGAILFYLVFLILIYAYAPGLAREVQDLVSKSSG